VADLAALLASDVAPGRPDDRAARGFSEVMTFLPGRDLEPQISKLSL
jgi:hypothetical protein